MLCMVGSGNGASKWAEMLFGHVWGGPVVGTTNSITLEDCTRIYLQMFCNYMKILGRNIIYKTPERTRAVPSRGKEPQRNGIKPAAACVRPQVERH